VWSPASIIGSALWKNNNHSMLFIFGGAVAFAAAIMLMVFYKRITEMQII
jgi:hypothetical protein